MLVVLLPFAAGCGVVYPPWGSPPPPSLTAPAVKLMRLDPVRVGAGTAEEVEVELLLRNLNEISLEIDGYHFVVFLDGEERPFASGRSRERIELPRFGEALTSMVVSAGSPRIVRQLELPGVGSDLEYEIRGNFLSGGRELPFSHTGHLLGTGTSY